MFQHLNEITASSCSSSAGNNEEVVAYTVTVGKKPSAAHAFVDDPAAVMDVLSTLIKSSQRDRRTSSSIDLATLTMGSQVE